MDDLSQKIGDILSDPSMMEQIRSLGDMLGMGAGAGAATGGSAPSPASASATSSTSAVPAAPPAPMPAAQSTLGGLSPDMLGMMMKLTPLLSSMNAEDESTRLLSALRPFLSEKRQSRIDSSIRLLSLMRMLPAIKTVFS